MNRHPTSMGIPLALIFALLFGFFAFLIVIGIRTDGARPSSPTTGELTPTTSGPTRPTQISPSKPVGPVRLEPSQVVVSSELSPDHRGDNLIDGDVGTAWRDASLHGDGAVITFTFPKAETVSAVILQGLTVDTEFHRSYRIRQFRLTPGNDSDMLEAEMPDTPEPFRVDLGGVVTSSIRLEVLSTYPAEAGAGEAATEELALAEIEILGRVSLDDTGE